MSNVDLIASLSRNLALCRSGLLRKLLIDRLYKAYVVAVVCDTEVTLSLILGEIAESSDPLWSATLIQMLNVLPDTVLNESEAAKAYFGVHHGIGPAEKIRRSKTALIDCFNVRKTSPKPFRHEHFAVIERAELHKRTLER